MKNTAVTQWFGWKPVMDDSTVERIRKIVGDIASLCMYFYTYVYVFMYVLMIMFMYVLTIMWPSAMVYRSDSLFRQGANLYGRMCVRRVS